MIGMIDCEDRETTELDSDTEVFLGMVCKIPLLDVEEIKRLLRTRGSRIVYQRLAAEPLRIVTQRNYEELARRDVNDDVRRRTIS